MGRPKRTKLLTVQGFSTSTFDPVPAPAQEPPKTIPFIERLTHRDFALGRARRYGTSNPTHFTIPFWTAMVRSGYDPYTARRLFLDGHTLAEQKREDEERYEKHGRELQDIVDAEKAGDARLAKRLTDEAFKPIAGGDIGESAEKEVSKQEKLEFTHVEYGMEVEGEGLAGGDPTAKFWSNPIWCDCRWFGTETNLPDGRVVKIGGEHEDFYDPDFLVYNDVIVFQAGADGDASLRSRNFDIYGYPEDVFPPTDGHTATFVALLDVIVIIGNMSAPEADKAIVKHGGTPAYVLNVDTWKMDKKVTTGDGPGILSGHKAVLQGDVIRITGSDEELCFPKPKHTIAKNGEMEDVKIVFGEAWELDLDSWTWKHQATEWETVAPKKRGRGRGRGRG